MRGLRAPHDFVRQGRGGDIDFMHRLPDQRIADRAADHPRLFAVAIEDPENMRQRPAGQPGGITKMRPRTAHLNCPGTSCPSSICGGT